MMSRWAFRFLLWYICIILTQPQNRFVFLHPLHIGDICVCLTLGFHIMSVMTENRRLIRLGPATIAGLLLLASGFISLYLGVYQTSSHWNGYIDQLAKSALILILVEAMADTAQRVWAVGATMLFATSWWIKGGLRLAAAGATHGQDRLMGPAVSLVENPNAFAYFMCVMIPLYLYFYQQSNHKILKWIFLAMAFSAMFIILQTGSRTGFLALVILGIFVFPKYIKHHKAAVMAGVAAVIMIMPLIGAMNVERFKSIGPSIKSFLSGELKSEDELTQSEQSAQERRLKNADTWRLVSDNLFFGVGVNPDESLFRDRYVYATGQVHNELLMAGRQMGIIGMSLYASFMVILALSGHAVQKRMREVWPAISDLGWTFKMQAVVFLVGGMFSPLPWSAPYLILAGAASALAGCLVTQYPSHLMASARS